MTVARGRSRIPSEKPASERTERRRAQRAREGKDAVIAVSRERPKAPAYLTPSQRSAWKQIVGDLEANGILAQSDGAAIEMVAVLLGRSRECAARIKKVGLFSEEGRKAADLQIKALNAARPYVEQLGLSPRGRSALGMSVSRAQGAPATSAGKGSAADPVSAQIGESPRLRALRGGKAAER